MIKAKKSLGQNFLIDQNVIYKIINIVDIKNRNILEIGPGTGNLTSAILNKDPKNLIVIEKDNKLSHLLKKKFRDRIKVINEDVLEIDENLLNKETLTVFGNLPYNISTKILSNNLRAILPGEISVPSISNRNNFFIIILIIYQFRNLSLNNRT